MESMGIERERLQIVFVSAAEGDRYRQICIDMDAKIRALGPSAIKQFQTSAT